MFAPQLSRPAKAASATDTASASLRAVSRPVAPSPAAPRPAAPDLESDPLEREADRLAERFAAAPLAASAAEVPPSGRGPAAARAGATPALLRDLLRSPGRSLAGPVRRPLESAYARNLDHVRIHDGEEAARATAALGALAFTHGCDIAFAPGRYAPASREGRTLLAHEIAHVVQQERGPARLQLKEDPKAKAAKTRMLPIRVYTPTDLEFDQLLLELIKQHLGAADDAEAAAIRKRDFSGSVPWSMSWSYSRTEEGSEPGFVWVYIDHPLIRRQQARRTEYFGDLNVSAQLELFQKGADELKDEKGKLPPPKLFAPEPGSAASLAANIDESIRQRQEIEALPEIVRDFLFDGPAPPTESAADVQAALAIAAKIGTLTESDLEEYEDSHPDRATDWGAFGRSIDAFLVQVAEQIEEEEFLRKGQTEELNALGHAFIHRYRAYEDMAWTIPRSRGAPAYGPKEKARDALDKDLIAAGFTEGIVGLGKLIRELSESFARAEARRIQAELNEFLHWLMLQEKRYQSTDDGERLGQAVSKTDAAADFDEALQEEVLSYLVPDIPGVEHGLTASVLKSSGRNKVLGAMPGHPLLELPGFDLDGLAHASPDEVYQLLMDDIAERRKGVANLLDKLQDSDFIFRNAEIFEAALAGQGIAKGSITEEILRERRSDEQVEEALEGAALIVVGVVLGAASGGTGWVAVGAELGTAALDAYSVYETLDSYQTALDAYKLGLSTQEPSKVEVAAGLAFDMIDLKDVSDALSTTNRAMPGSKKLLDGFDSPTITHRPGRQLYPGTDVEKRPFELPGDLDETITAANETVYDLTLIESVDNVKQAASTLGGPLGLTGGWLSDFLPGGINYNRFVYLAALGKSRKIDRFHKFLNMAETKTLLGGIKPRGADRTLLKAAYDQATLEVEMVAAHCKKMGLGEDAALDVLEVRDLEGLSYQEVMGEITVMRTASDLSDAEQLAVGIDNAPVATPGQQLDVFDVPSTLSLGSFPSVGNLKNVTLSAYQAAVDAGYERALKVEAKIKEARLNNDPELASQPIRAAMGRKIDKTARNRMRLWFWYHQVDEGPDALVKLNLRLMDPTGTGLFSIPDLRVGSVFFDASLTPKDWSTEQIREFFKFGMPTEVWIVRPTKEGGSYKLKLD